MAQIVPLSRTKKSIIVLFAGDKEGVLFDSIVSWEIHTDSTFHPTVNLTEENGNKTTLNFAQINYISEVTDEQVKKSLSKGRRKPK